MRTGIALGSNIGDRLQNLREARKAIVDLAGVHQPVLSSTIYETDAVNCESGAAKFLNAVIEVEFEGEAADLLAGLKQIEVSMGRPGNHARNVSRKIDIDLLYFGNSVIDDKELKVPHPRMHTRRFVLQPLADICPDLAIPGQNRTASELLALTDDSAKIIRLTDDWELP